MKKRISTTDHLQKVQREMILEFIQRRYKELYDQDIGGYIGEEYADIITSPQGSIDFVNIQDCVFSIDNIRTAQAYNIPCKTMQDWFWEMVEKDSKINIWIYHLKRKKIISIV